MEHWTQERYAAFREGLFAQAEEGYRQFHARLLRSDLPVIGLRMPLLRRQAQQIAKEDGEGFLRLCGRDSYEERLLYGLVAAALPVCYAEFLPYCDCYVQTLAENWAHCDGFCTSLKKRLRGHEDAFFDYIEKYLRSQNPWAIRIALVTMLMHYLTEEYLAQSLLRMGEVHAEHYYVRMAQAWLLATAWAKNRQACLTYLDGHPLDDWTLRKFVQKARESYRISPEDKELLRRMVAR